MAGPRQLGHDADTKPFFASASAALTTENVRDTNARTTQKTLVIDFMEYEFDFEIAILIIGNHIQGVGGLKKDV